QGGVEDLAVAHEPHGRSPQPARRELGVDRAEAEQVLEAPAVVEERPAGEVVAEERLDVTDAASERLHPGGQASDASSSASLASSSASAASSSASAASSSASVASSSAPGSVASSSACDIRASWYQTVRMSSSVSWVVLESMSAMFPFGPRSRSALPGEGGRAGRRKVCR